MRTNSSDAAATFVTLARNVAGQIKQDSSFQPGVILGLGTGGFPVATLLSKLLGINSRFVVGMPVWKGEDARYRFDHRYIDLACEFNLPVLVVDDSSRRGILLAEVVTAIEERNNRARSCALLVWRHGTPAHYLAESYQGDTPNFFWDLGG